MLSSAGLHRLGVAPGLPGQGNGLKAYRIRSQAASPARILAPPAAQQRLC